MMIKSQLEREKTVAYFAEIYADPLSSILL